MNSLIHIFLRGVASCVGVGAGIRAGDDGDGRSVGVGVVVALVEGFRSGSLELAGVAMFGCMGACVGVILDAPMVFVVTSGHVGD